MENLVKKPIKYEDLFSSKDKLKSPWEFIDILRERTILLHSKSFPKVDQTYIYDPRIGIYKEYATNELTLIITRIMEISLIPASMHQIKQMVDFIKYYLNADLGFPKIDTEHLAFENGLFNINTGQLTDWTPDIFLISRMPGIWPSDFVIPVKFLNFLNTLCEGDQERVNFLRAISWAALTSYTEAQILVLMEGPGASGKSTFANILEAIVGKEYCISTSFRELSRSPFETTTLRGKKLVFFNDVDSCKGDLSLLKQLVGGDTIRGRVKHKMDILDFKLEAIIIMASNQPIFYNDTGNALARRVRTFPAHHVIPVSERRSLLYQTGKGYSGELATELPYIRKWIHKTPSELDRVKDYLHLTATMVPSLSSAIEEASETMNPLLSWIKEEIEKGEGSYVGFKIKQDPKSYIEISRRKPLYPTYRIWAEKRDILPLGHRRFTHELVWNLKHLGFEAEKVRKNEGMYIEGIQVKEDVYNHDNKYGAPLTLSKISNLEIHNPKTDDCISFTPEINKQHPALFPDLYNSYKQKLDKTPLKTELNAISKGITLDLDKLMDEYFKDVPEPTQSYRDRMMDVISRGAQSIKSFGAIPYKYKSMGVSPRILPISYGSSINNTKRILRQEIYSHLGKYLNGQNKVIVDLDLRSCYTSIVIGLYPKSLEALQMAIEGEGLWEYIRKEFIRNGRGDVYNKSSVKICVYSSFFMGGSKAMIEGILDAFRKDIGVTQSQFKISPDYEYFHTIARTVTQEMQKSSVITDFRSVSNTIKETYMDEYLIGPTGHGYKVTEDSFRSAYPNFLQSYEFALLADTTLRVMEEFDVELIGHYHDGNVLIVPKDSQNLLIQRFSDKLEKLGKVLGLRYPQRIEVKKVYG